VVPRSRRGSRRTGARRSNRRRQRRRQRYGGDMRYTRYYPRRRRRHFEYSRGEHEAVAHRSVPKAGGAHRCGRSCIW